MTKKVSKTKTAAKKQQLPSLVVVIVLIALILVAVSVTLQKNPVTEPTNTPADSQVDDNKDTTTPAVNTQINPEKATTAIKVYYPYDTGADTALKPVTYDVVLEPNETKLQRAIKLMRNPQSLDGTILTPLLGPDANILSIERQDGDILKIDVTQEFINQMNAGANLEGAIIKGFVTTICALNDAKGVLLRVEGNLYESGHYLFQENEVIYPEF